MSIILFHLLPFINHKKRFETKNQLDKDNKSGYGYKFDCNVQVIRIPEAHTGFLTYYFKKYL